LTNLHAFSRGRWSAFRGFFRFLEELMMRTGIVFGLFGAALISAIAFFAISDATVVPMVAKGSGPGGVQVTTSGWFALLMSALGTGGFTLAGIVTAVASRFGIPLPGNSSETLISEVVELTASFAALMRDKTNRAAQRRFFFALVDAASLIQGCETSHEAGVISIKYRGYAEPAVAETSK
jgi:hypothetical protein